MSKSESCAKPIALFVIALQIFVIIYLGIHQSNLKMSKNNEREPLHQIKNNKNLFKNVDKKDMDNVLKWMNHQNDDGDATLPKTKRQKDIDEMLQWVRQQKQRDEDHEDDMLNELSKKPRKRVKKKKTLKLEEMTPSHISMFYAYHKKSNSLRERPSDLPEDHLFVMNKPHHASYDKIDFSKTKHPSKFKIAMVTTDRPHYFKVALESLSNVVFFDKDQLSIYEYGSSAETKKIVNENNLHHVVNPRKHFGEGAMHIAHHYKFVMEDMFKRFPGDDAILIVEDDLMFSPDFLIYFSDMYPLLKDPTVYAISAYNDNGFKGLVHNDNMVYRTDFFIGLGWLVKRQLWEGEWRARWPASHWDHFLRQRHVRKNRHTLYPEISRVYHIGYKGTHSSINMYNQYFRNILLNGNGHARVGISPHWKDRVGEDMIDLEEHETPTLDYIANLENYDCFLNQYFFREHDGQAPKKGIAFIKDVSELSEYHVLRDGDEFGDVRVAYLPNASPARTQNWDSISKYFGVWHSFPIRSMLNGIISFYWGQYRIVLVSSWTTLMPQTLSVEKAPLGPISASQPLWFHEQKSPSITKVLSAEAGQSCDAVCSSHRLSCTVEGLLLINNCLYLQRHFDCKQCVKNRGSDHPAFDLSSKRCLFTSVVDPSCSASRSTTKRLCACSKSEIHHAFHWEWHDHLAHAQNEKENPSHQKMDSITKYHIQNPELAS
mmetsp:Transcript_4098/g.6075  ORF Transcript_4098/g.6075 Transcript_4098/m.6075 type:complete len:715 (-) Transcript_4098:13-2157(-)